MAEGILAIGRAGSHGAPTMCPYFNESNYWFGRCMSVLGSRTEQLASHLRNQLSHGQLADPLPNTREWSKQLEVGRNTLGAALRILEQEGLIIHHGTRGFHLQGSPPKLAPLDRKFVRIISYWPEYRGHHNAGSSLVSVLAEKLHSHNIDLRSERWSDTHFHTFDKARPVVPGPNRELFILPSLPPKYLSMFTRAARPCLLVGVPPKGISLPHLYCDWEGAIRHATFYLARRGFQRIILIVRQSHAPSHSGYCETFQAACREAPNAPIQHEICRPSLSLDSQVATAERLAARIKGRTGIIVAGPLSISTPMTVLLGRGIRISGQVEFVFTNSLPELLMVHPTPAHYPYPLEGIVKTLSRVVIQYFETGRLARLRKVIPVEMVKPHPER